VHLWLPRQHGAWPMLAVPLLLGVAAAGADAWQVVLAGAAATGYLASATTQVWLRARRRRVYTPSLVAYGAASAVLGASLVMTHPVLLAALVVLIPAAVVTALAARSGRPRGLAESIAQVAMAVVLTPAAAVLAGPIDVTVAARATLLAALYLVGTVLMVRSVIRERGNAAFAALSIGYHVLAAVVMALVLPLPYAVLGMLLAVRAAALPFVQRRWAGSAHPLRPVQVGMVEMVSAIALVGLAFVVPV
jgi:YwiC-like protein